MPSRRTFLRDVATASAFTAARAQTPPPARRTFSTSTRTIPAATSSPTATPSRRRTCNASPPEGVLFRRAFSCAPTCSPSRSALLTGQFPHQNGMLGLAHRGFSMNDYRKHILYTLRDAGYQSVLGGLQHIADKPERIGYDELLQPKSTRAADVAPAAVAFLE